MKRKMEHEAVCQISSNIYQKMKKNEGVCQRHVTDDAKREATSISAVRGRHFSL